MNTSLTVTSKGQTSKPVTIVDLSEQVSRHLRPDLAPLRDAGRFYQKNRPGNLQ